MLYCIPDEAPLGVPLVPPDSNWGNPLAITIEAGDLYLLDPLTNAVWIYYGGESAFREAPRFFFGNQVPSMQSVIDLAVNREDLYLIHDDGHMTTCTFSSLQESPTRCTDPAPFTDNRPGRTGGEKIPDARFLRIARTPPPEPSLYMLDPITQSIYHFSLRLTLVRQYRSLNPLPDEIATAFAVGANRSLFLALGNKVYIAFLP
jgi:hypothetical protein